MTQLKYRLESKSENISIDVNKIYGIISPLIKIFLRKHFSLLLNLISGLSKENQMNIDFQKCILDKIDQISNKLYSNPNNIAIHYLMVFYYLENEYFLEFFILICMGIFDKSSFLNLISNKKTNINKTKIANDFYEKINEDCVKDNDFNIDKDDKLNDYELELVDSVYNNKIIIKEIERIKLIFSLF